MCISFIAINESQHYPIILAFNRDEFYKRPAKQLRQWEDENLIAGLDEQSNGTWMATDTGGRFAALTHFRDPKNHKTGMRSRGSLVPEFIRSQKSPSDFLSTLSSTRSYYNGYNMIIGDRNDVFYYSQRNDTNQKLESGIYGLSNGHLNSDWPKVNKGLERIKEAIISDYSLNQILDLMLDSTLAEDSQLPDTGVGYRIEKAISSIFVLTPDYGTRTSSIYVHKNNGNKSFIERTFENNSKTFAETKLDF